MFLSTGARRIVVVVGVVALLLTSCGQSAGSSEAEAAAPTQATEAQLASLSAEPLAGRDVMVWFWAEW